MSGRPLSTTVEAISDWQFAESWGLRPDPDALKLVHAASGGDTVYAVSGSDSFVIDVEGEASVLVDCAGRRILATDIAGSMAAADVQQFIDDHVAPRILSHAGAFVLHAGSVQVGDRCLLIAGDTGLGKSTLTGGLDAGGWPLLGDDAALFGFGDGAVTARSTYRRLCLLPDSLRAIAGIDVGADPAQDHKHRVPLQGEAPASQPRAIAAILVLADAGVAAPHLTPMSGSSACLALVSNSFALDPTDTGRARVRIRQATDVASRVPIFSLDYPRRYEMLPAVQDLIRSKLSGPGAGLPSGKPSR